MAKDPTKVANKWKTNLSAATPSIIDGVNAVTEAPGVAAGRNLQGYLMGVQANAEKWKKRVEAVPLESWKRATLDLGVQRIAQGAQANVGKVEEFMREFIPHVEAGKNMLKTMPKVGLEDGIARMVAMARHNAAFKRSR